MRSSVCTMATSCSATSGFVSFFMNSSVSATYLSKHFSNASATAAGASTGCSCSFTVHDLMRARHWKPVAAEMYSMPARDTVAGLAYTRSRISNSMRMWGFSGMRSLDASVSILLSSMTLFMDSIQLASRSPSRIIHLGVMLRSAPRSRIIFDSRPSFHSRVAMVM